VHTDSRAADSARSVGAAAYTFGGHVVFGEGKFQPGSADGSRLLAHELAHVIQQDESGVAGAPESLGQPRDAAEEWADRQSRSALAGAPIEAPAPTAKSRVQRQTNPQADPADSPAPATAAAPAAGWTLSDPSVTFTISNQHIMEASFLKAGGPALTGAGFNAWTNQRVFSILTPEQAWLRTQYQVDTTEHPLPDQNMKFSVTNDIRFTTSSGQTTIDQHFQDDSPAYGGAGGILGTKLGFSAGDRTLPILELPLNEGGVLTWSAGFIFQGGGGVGFQASGTFQVRSDKPAAPNPPAGAVYGPEKAPGGAADQPAAKGTPLPKSPGTPKVPPEDLAQIDALANAVREATEIAKKTFLLGQLRDKLAGLEPGGIPKADLTKLIDEALDSLAKEGVKAGLKTLLEAITGTSATTMPEDRNPRGPNVPEGVPGQKTQSLPKIPLDFGTKRPANLAFHYEKGWRSSYAAGEFMKFTVVLPDNQDLVTGLRLVIVPAAEAKSANHGKLPRDPVPLTSKTQVIDLRAPDEPGKYVILVDVGMGPVAGSAQEFEVTAAKK
jgi:Domain of unknown function (DUF4157)